jgi:hypothetical protein
VVDYEKRRLKNQERKHEPKTSQTKSDARENVGLVAKDM